MQSWSWALLLKPFIGIAIMAGLYFGARSIAWLLYHLTPDCRFKRWLFLDWERERARRPAKAGQGILDHPPIVSGEPLQDDSRTLRTGEHF